MTRFVWLLASITAGLCLSIARADDEAPLLEWRIDSPETGHVQIAALAVDGKVQVRFQRASREAPDQFRRRVGRVWAAVPYRMPERPEMQLMSGETIEATQEGLTVQLSQEAVQRLAVGDLLLVQNAQEDPGWTFVKSPISAGRSPDKDAATAEFESATEKNLRQIVIALHNYHDVYRGFPPAVVYGPDGKPWHSWRVLILPFLDPQLFQAYRFDQPWDGEHNRKLLDQKPAVFHDPTRGAAPDTLTHYAAVVGKSAFLSDPAIAIGADGQLRRNVATRMADIVDGTSNTIALGMVSPKREIPWTKPEDIESDELGMIDAVREAFAWPYGVEESPAGSFAFIDGSVRLLPKSLANETFYYLLTINDGQAVPRFEPAKRASPVLRLWRKSGELSAELVFVK